MRLFFVGAFFVIYVLMQLFSGSLVLDGKWVRQERLHEFFEPTFPWSQSDPFFGLVQNWTFFPKLFYLDEYTTLSDDLYDALQIVRLPVSATQDLVNDGERSVALMENVLNTSAAHQNQNVKVNVQRVRQKDPHIRDAPFHDVEIPEYYKHMNGRMENGSPFRHFDLPRVTATHHPTYGWKRFFIALDLYKNEDLIFFLTGALVAFIEDEIAPFFNVQTSVVVSIFSNHPSEELRTLIHDFLLPHLRHAGVHYIYIGLDGTCLGYSTRPKWMGRIEWMACVRNKAIEPLYLWGMRVFDPELYENPFPCGLDNALKKGSACVNLYLRGTRLDRVTMSLNNLNNKTSDFLRDDVDGDKMVVLFFNDIYFRPTDITSLLESVQESSGASDAHPDGIVHENKRSSDAIKRGKAEFESNAGGTTFDMACGMDFYFSFYDTWVSRDRHGEPFLPQMPFTEDPETQTTLRRIISAASTDGASGKRLSIPVKCCWNGVAAIRGQLFIKPIRRGGGKPELWRSEGSNGVYKKTVNPEEVFELWGGNGYHLVLDAPEQVYQMHWMTLLHRLVEYRHGWMNYMDKKAKNFGLTFSTHIKHDIRSLREEYNESMLQKLNSGMRHLAKEVKNPHHSYYRSDAPSLRFRHALMPSFGGTAEKRYSVSDDVCYASECLLFCQDVMHAAILDGRAPVVLMNPNVRVAYESVHFDYVTSWLYNSQTVFTMSIWLNYIIVWVKSVFGFSDMVLHDKKSSFATSSADDWTAGDINRIVNVSYGRDHVLELNVTKFTSMTCFSPARDDSRRAFLGPICRLISIIVCVMLCTWMIRTITRAPPRQCLPKSVSYSNEMGERSRWVQFVIALRWCILRAVVHPRGNMIFGCPRFLSLIARRMLVFCGYKIPIDPDGTSLVSSDT